MYCDKAGLVARFGEDELTRLTDDGDGQMDDNIINAALSDASDEINTYIAVRHSLPLEQTPELLVRLCADMARYRLYDNRMIDEVKKRYDDSVQLLKDIARGTAILPIPERTTASEISAVRDLHDRVFTRETLEDF
ncbi:MAG: gp436 family protein [Endozoicomonas sp.]